MVKYRLIIGLIFLSKLSSAQFNETIRTGRPGQAIGPHGVGRYVFQSQTGYDFGGWKQNFGYSGTNNAVNTVLRFGISKRVDINSGLEYRKDNYSYKNWWNDSIFHTASTHGLSLASIGARINILEASNSKPGLGIQVSLKSPWLSEDYSTENIAPRVLVIASQNIGEKFAILVNAGVDFDGFSNSARGVYVLNLGYSIAPKWSTFIENYGAIRNSYFENRWDGGFAYLYNENLQFDIYGGYGYNHNPFTTKDWFTSVGISWRIITLRNKLIKE